MPMHPGQVHVGVHDVERALAEQVPELAGLPVERVASAGTTAAIFRVGEAFAARVPLVPDADARDALAAEFEQAHALSGQLPLEVPRPIHRGEPFEGYPGVWSVWTWLDGDSLDHLLATQPALGHSERLACDLAGVLRWFHSQPAGDWSDNGRGGRPLADSAWVRTSIERAAHLIDTRLATEVWERALAAPPHTGPARRIHSDPMPGNFLLRAGRLAGMVDIGAPVWGDPAASLQPAWTTFDGHALRRFRIEMDADAAAWERGRGWAFEMAIAGLWYYEHSNRPFFDIAERTLSRLLVEAGRS